MPRRRAAPRLYLDKNRRTWIIRDGASFIRTGCSEPDRHGAERRLSAHLAQKHRPEPSPTPLIADVLLAYASEHLPHTREARNASYHIGCLSTWWGDRKLSDVTAKNCRVFAQGHKPTSARRYLETLRAAIGHWHREYGPLPSVPAVVMPPKREPRENWLTRSEAARLLRAAKRTEHLKRFILLGLWTGSRSSAILSLQWERIDFATGVMRRRGYGEAESTTKRTPPVRLSKRAILFLRRWRASDDVHSKFVVQWNGKRISNLRRSWDRAAEAAGVCATPHTLRHTRATWLMREGVEPWEASGHLGMSLEMLMRVYGHHHPDSQKRAAEVTIGLRGPKKTKNGAPVRIKLRTRMLLRCDIIARGCKSICG
jgi:integrase